MKLELSAYQNMHYAYDNHPGVIRTLDDARIEGLNCETLTHLALRDLGIQLPKEMRAMEIFQDDNTFIDVPEDAELELGDVFFFGKNNEDDPKKLHLAVFTGQHDGNGSPLLIHANWQDKGVSIWPLDKFGTHKRYQSLHAVKRYNVGRSE
jgi:cell wall-associated NlpC family hydrolase